MHSPCWTTAPHPAEDAGRALHRRRPAGGSRTLSRASGLELSPATIRNVMADLEELGLIASPHTSAGRVPTARGYRLFVDTMLTARPLDLDRGAARDGRRARAAAPRPAAARDRAGGAAAVQPVELRRRGHGAAQGQRVPPHRVPAPGRAPRAGDPGRARRRRAEPRHLHRARPHAGRAGRGHQLPQRALRRPDHRRSARAPASTRSRRCAARSRR
jgi:hypothetical protein